MAVERAAGGTSLIDVLDRVLDKGIIVDEVVRFVSIDGINLIRIDDPFVVSSTDLLSTPKTRTIRKDS